LLNSNKVQKAIKVLSEVITKYKSDKTKSVYILLAMAYNKNKQSDRAIEVLNESLRLYKNYIDAFIAKGNLFVDEKKWIEARECFSAVIRIDKSVAAGYLGLANCEYNLLHLNEADAAYTQAIHLGSVIPHEGNDISNKLERLNMARLKLKLKDLNAAQEIIEDIFKDLPSNDCAIARALLIKGRIMEKQKNCTEAAMNYEQAANYGSIDISALALYKLAKLRIREKDYYEAYFDIKRVQSTNKKIKSFYTLIDGVLFYYRVRLYP
jgi:tetratricopeptide (TPR) repeat protein